MSTDEQRRPVGDLSLQHREAKQQVEMICARLREVGHSLLTIAQLLLQEQFDAAADDVRGYRSDVVDLAALGSLLADFKTAKDRKDRYAHFTG